MERIVPFKEVKSDFLRIHWDTCSDLYHDVLNSSYYYNKLKKSAVGVTYDEKMLEDDSFDIDIVLDAFKKGWRLLYKSYVLESMRGGVMDFFYDLQSGKLEEQVSSPYKIQVIYIDYDLLLGFRLRAEQSYTLYPWNEYKEFQPHLFCKNLIGVERNHNLEKMCVEIYKEHNLTKLLALEDILNHYMSFANLMIEDEGLNQGVNHTYFIDFMRDCWKKTKQKTNSKVLGFLHIHEELSHTSLDDKAFSMTIDSSEMELKYIDYLKGKGVKF